MNSANRIAYNSIALYVNMIVTMGVSLLGTRFVLKALGSNDYAVYALISNIVALFSFLNVAMAGATQRFLSFALGKGEDEELKEIFYNSSVIHKAISALSILLLLATGVPAIEYWLDIPLEAHSKALAVLICMAGGVFFVVNSVPYEAAINAHEDILVIAGVNIFEAFLKLAISVLVLYIPDGRLITYAVLIMCIYFVSYIIKRTYSRRKYIESHYKWHKIKNFVKLKQMAGFAGWNLVGTGCSIMRYQGSSVLLNNVFGLVYNAAYGVAQQVNGFLLFFANSAIRPLRPHIIKNEGAGRHGLTIKYSYFTSRLVTSLLAIAIIPLYINMPYVLDVWLGTPPLGVTEFCRGFLVITLIGQFASGQQIALESVGKIKNQHIAMGIMHILPLPVTFILYKIGMPFYTIMYSVIVEEIICVFIRTVIARKDAGMPAGPFLIGFLAPCVICILSTSFLTNYMVSSLEGGVKLIVSMIISTLVYVPIAYRFCFTAWEREKLAALVRGFVAKIRKR